MSILIKGMAIPKNCGECPCYYDGYCQGIPYNEDDEDFREVSYKEYDKKRRDDCPLIELPDIYIDIAKAFMTELTDKVCIKGDEDNEHTD